MPTPIPITDIIPDLGQYGYLKNMYVRDIATVNDGDNLLCKLSLCDNKDSASGTWSAEFCEQAPSHVKVGTRIDLCMYRDRVPGFGKAIALYHEEPEEDAATEIPQLQLGDPLETAIANIIRDHDYLSLEGRPLDGTCAVLAAKIMQVIELHPVKASKGDKNAKPSGI